MSHFPYQDFEWETGVTRFTQLEWLLTTLVCYFLSVTVLSKYMEMRESKLPWVDSYAFVHNVVLALLSLVLMVAVLVGAAQDNRFEDLDSFLCHRPGKSSGLVPFTLYMVYLSKVLEFGDTWIMISSKRKVHWIHRMHHLSTMGVVWHAMHSNMSADILCAATNLFGHVLLYSFFAFPKPSMKKWVNLSQLFQFGSCLVGMCFMLNRRLAGTPCEGSLFAELHGFVMYSIYIAHMTYSYSKRYSKLRSARKDNQPDATPPPAPSFRVADSTSITSDATVSDVLAATPTPCGELGELISPCGDVLAEKVETPCLDVDDPKDGPARSTQDQTPLGLHVSIPSEYFQKSFSPALRIVAKTVALAVVGVCSIACLPNSMSPVGIVLLGIAMSWLLVIGHDCSTGTFFPSRLANDIVGTIALLPLLRPIESFRVEASVPHDADKDAAAPREDSLQNLLSENGATSNVLSRITVWTFAAAFAWTIVDHQGIYGLVKYWVLPYAVMHLNMRVSNNHGPANATSKQVTPPSSPRSSKSGAEVDTYQLLFPELSDFTKLPAPLERALAGIDLGRIPVYNLPKVFEYIASTASTTLADAIGEGEEAVNRVLFVKPLQGEATGVVANSDEKPSFAHRLMSRLPSRLLSREILFWGKRDALLWVALFAMGFVVTTTQWHDDMPAWVSENARQVLRALRVGPDVLAFVPVVAVVLLVFPKMTATTAIRHFHRSSKLYKAQLERGSEHLEHVQKMKTQQLDEQKRRDALKIERYEANQKLAWLPYLKANANWPMGIYITLSHVLAVIGLTVLGECKWQTLLWAFALWPIAGLGITAGVHRLWAHKSYDAHISFRFLVMIFNSIANQGNIYHWSRDHRVHHKWSETTADPHNALRGFFFAHMGWLYVVKDPRVAMAGRKINMDDLLRMPEVVLQRNLDPFWNLFWCFAFPGIVASYGWGESAWNGFLVPGALRYVFVLHMTWLVNSAAHLWGETPYENMNPAENPWVSIGAIGEGWHNWHHTFPYDYAASELGVSQQYNPTKLFIDTAAKLGLVWKRKRADKHWQKRLIRRAKASAEDPDAIKDIPDSQLVVEETLIGYPIFKRRVVTIHAKSQ